MSAPLGTIHNTKIIKISKSTRIATKNQLKQQIRNGLKSNQLKTNKKTTQSNQPRLTVHLSFLIFLLPPLPKQLQNQNQQSVQPAINLINFLIQSLIYPKSETLINQKVILLTRYGEKEKRARIKRDIKKARR